MKLTRAKTGKFTSKRNVPLVWQETDKKRKDLADEALRELRRRKLIRDFVRTGDLSVADILRGLRKRRGLDFYVIYIDDIKYRVCPLSITDGLQPNIRQRYPKRAVINIDLYEGRESIKSKILREIEWWRKTLSH